MTTWPDVPINPVIHRKKQDLLKNFWNDLEKTWFFRPWMAVRSVA